MIDVESIDPLPVEEVIERIETTDGIHAAPEMLLTPADQRKYPWRNPDVLEAVWEEYGTLGHVAEELGCGGKAIRRWLNVFGIYGRYDHAPASRRLEQLNPEDLGLSPMDSKAGGDA